MGFPASTWFLLVLLSIAVILVSRWLLRGWMRRRKLVSMMDKLPHSKGHFLLGNLDELMVPRTELFNAQQSFVDRFRNEPLFGMWLGPTSPRVTLIKAEAVQALLSTNHSLEKSKFYLFLHSWIGRGLLTSGGSKWHSRRKMLTPTFHFKLLDEFVDLVNEQAITFASKLEHHADKGKPFNVCPLLSLCMLDIICETAMQRNVNAQRDNSSEYVRAVNDSTRILTRRLLNPWLHFEWLFALSSIGKEYKKNLNILHNFTDKVIAERRQENINEQSNIGSVSLQENVAPEDVFGRKKRRAFLDTLLDCFENGQKLSDESIREEVDTFMFEGHDTTSTGIMWTLFLLGHNPLIQDKIHEELHAVFGDSNFKGFLSSSNLKELKYLECVIKESLRLYPPVHLYARTLSCDTHIAGYDLPGGISIQVNAFALHRDPRYFPDPETFDPDRFLPENSVTRPAYAYVPFSAGARNCIGQKFAMMEEKVVLAHLLHRFQVTSMEQIKDITLLSEIVLRPANGLWIKVEKRNCSS